MEDHYPWYCRSPHMRTNLLIMCKLLFLLLLINGFWGYKSDPFIPFIRALDIFNNSPGLFQALVKSLFLGAGIGLMFNVKVRWMAIMLGISVILFLLASKPRFRNHIFICACAFLLAGLSDKEKDPWLLIWQLSLVYLGAVLNKVLQADWWNGQFMHNWLLVARENEFYASVAPYLPDRLLARLLSWSSMAIELWIGIALLFKKQHSRVIWVILIFHTLLYGMTGFRFGHFYEDILVYLLVFLYWPESDIAISVSRPRIGWKRVLLSIFNWNRQFIINDQPIENAKWLKVEYGNNVEYNQEALGSLILYSPATYFMILLLDSGIRYLFPAPQEQVLTMIWLTLGLLFFLKRKFKIRRPRPYNA